MIQPERKKGITTSRLIRAEDLYNFVFVADPRVSPDSSVVIVFTVSRARSGDDYSSDIWCYSDQKVRRLTYMDARCHSPRWSPDSKQILFLAARKEGTDLFIMLLEDGKAKRILRRKKIADPMWSPDGSRIYFLSSTLRETEERQSEVKIIDRIRYKLNGVGFIYNDRTHLYCIDIASRNQMIVTEGEYNVNSYSVSPDGNTIAFISNMVEDPDLINKPNIYKISTKGGKIYKITDNEGPISAVSWSSSGKSLAYIGNDYHLGAATNKSIWVVSPSKHENITIQFDRSATNSMGSDVRLVSYLPPNRGPVWSPDEEFIYFIATDKGTCHVFKVNTNNNIIERVTKGNITVDSFDFSRNHTVMAYTAMDSLHLPEVWVKDTLGSRRITNFNSYLLDELKLSKPRRFAYKASDGVEIEGWLIPPVNPNGGKPPAVVEIHGGGTTYGYSFMHEFQLLAANNIAVIYINFRYTPGYGEDYANITGHYLERDYEDIMDGVNYVVKNGWVDENRLGVTGSSYGGWATNWIICHTTKFKAAVTDASISNLYSLFGTSDNDYKGLPEEIILGLPWEVPYRYLEKSPITYVKNIKTPLLIIHSEEDLRCPIEQAEQLFVSLKRLKKDVLFARFPREDHNLARKGKPKNRIERFNLIIQWFKKYLDENNIYQTRAPI